MKLSTLKYLYDEEYAKIARESNYVSKDYALGHIDGTVFNIKSLIFNYEDELTDIPELKDIEDSDVERFKKEPGLQLVKTITVFNCEYPIYMDDYGQCYCICIDDEFVSLGTYNTDIEMSCVFEVFNSIIDRDKMEISYRYDGTRFSDIEE